MLSFILLDKAKMSTRAEFYSGRGPSRWDCGAEQLSIIYDGILKEIGQDAANNFAEMIGDLECAGASEIIRGLYRLEDQQWVYQSVKMSRAESLIDAAGKRADGSHNMESLTLGVMSMLSDNRSDEAIRHASDNIKMEFFQRNNLHPKSFLMDNRDAFCDYNGTIYFDPSRNRGWR